MPVPVLPVEVLPAEPPVDLHVVLSERGAPVRDARRLDAAEDRVELDVAHPETVVVALEVFPIREVEGERVVDVDRRERALRLLPRDVEQAGERARRCDGITRRDDEVVELNRHGAPPAMVFCDSSMLVGRRAVKTTLGAAKADAGRPQAPVICLVS